MRLDRMKTGPLCHCFWWGFCAFFPLLFPFSAHNCHVFVGIHYQNPICTPQRFQEGNVVLFVKKNAWNEITSIISIESFKEIRTPSHTLGFFFFRGKIAKY